MTKKEMVNAVVEINYSLISALTKQENIPQKIVETMAKELKATRCVLFTIFTNREDFNAYCKIVAGVPANDHGIGETMLIEEKDDLFEALKNGKMLSIENSENNPLTEKFWCTIKDRNISEILYVPLIRKVKGRMVGIIVIDALNGRKFDEEEKIVCDAGAKIISAALRQKEILVQSVRDMVFGPIAGVMGQIKRVEKLSQKIVEATNEFTGKIHKPSQNIIEITMELNRTLEQIEKKFPKHEENL